MKQLITILTVFVFILSDFARAQTVLFDDFQRVNNNTVGNSWVETETVSPTSANITANLLKLNSTAISGREYCVSDVSTNYNTVFSTNTASLTWAFNIRQTRTDPSGFDPGNYGVAFVLGCNTNNFMTGSGYAVVLGNSGTSDNLRLVRFGNGLSTNAGLVNIIAPAVDYGADYLTVKVVYNPIGNTWSLYVGSNLGFFDNPFLAAYTQLGSTLSDATYTGNDLLYMGCFWNHVTSGSDFGNFDNVRIPAACLLAPEPTLPSTTLGFSSIGANSVTLNWTRGNGSDCIIFAHLGGPVSGTPLDGASYFSNTTYGSGSLISANEYVVYMGSANTITINGLIPTTTYEFRIFEYNGSGCTINFLVSPPAIGTVTTIGCVLNTEPNVSSSGLTASNIMPNTMDLTWLRGNGAFCILLGRAGGPITTPPADGIAYTSNAIFGSGSSTGAGEFVLYSGTGNTVSLTGLLPGTSYSFSVYEMNGTGCNVNYLIPGAASGNAITPAAASYIYYFGNLHSHSDYSDGDIDNVCNGANSAYCCFDIGNTALNFDYMGISDHNHNEGPVMTLAKYASGLAEAINYNNTHIDFVALYGMEWGTISTGGHINVYGINQLVGWNPGNYNIYCAKGDYNTILNLVASTPNAFVTLCHPNNSDFGNLLTNPYNIIYDNAIVGTAIRNGSYNSTSIAYNDPSTSNTVPYFNNLLSKGYHVGPTADLDNHNSATMGKSSQQRTVLLATALTKNAITDAITNMRFYATDDYNIHVAYDINGNIPMGSITSQNGDPTIHVTVTDPDIESVASIKIYYGVPGSNILPTVLTSVTNSPNLSFLHSFLAGTFYYYAEIIQADGNVAYTAPIWYTKTSIALPVTLLSFEGNATANGNELLWHTASELNNDYFTLTSSTDGLHFKPIANITGSGTTNIPHVYSFTDRLFSAEINYYRLMQTDFNGSHSWSNTVVLRSTRGNPLFLFPNPGNGHFTLNNPGAGEKGFLAKVIDETGRLVYQSQTITEFQSELDLHFLAKGIYTLIIVDDFRSQVLKMAIQ